jgi:hypothetical protein
MTVTHDAETSPTLYRHETRPGWGLALMAWDSADKCAFQFDDGKLRIFKKGFHHLMKPVQVDEAVERRVATELEDTLEANGGRRRKPLEPAYPFSDQLKIFETLYPEGFRGERWATTHRGVDDASLKRHRDRAVERAQESMAQAELDALVGAGEEEKIVDRAIEVLKHTNLARLGRVKGLERLEGEERKEAGRRIRDLLHGDDRFGVRFRAWLRTLDSGLERGPSWRLATALPALVHPEEHVCVRHSAFRRQAAIFGPSRLYSRRPKRTSYENYRRVAQATKERLEDEGYSPRDLLDVHDFIWVTLRPSARKVLEG